MTPFEEVRLLSNIVKVGLGDLLINLNKLISKWIVFYIHHVLMDSKRQSEMFFLKAKNMVLLKNCS